jgi:hypothetical protein
MTAFFRQLLTVDAGTPSFAAMGRMPSNFSKTLGKSLLEAMCD